MHPEAWKLSYNLLLISIIVAVSSRQSNHIFSMDSKCKMIPYIFYFNIIQELKRTITKLALKTLVLEWCCDTMQWFNNGLTAKDW